MAKNTRDRILKVKSSIDNHLVTIKSQFMHLQYVYQQAEEEYGVSYAERIVMLHSFLEAADTWLEAWRQYCEEYR